MSWVLDGPDLAGAEQAILDALQQLGTDSDTVARTLHRLSYPLTDAAEAVCLYLDATVADPTTVEIDGCDTITVDYRVINPDGETWSHASTRLPWPVLVFCSRADNGDFPAVAS